MSETRGHSTSTLLLAFVAGAVAGAAIAVLTSPRSGAEVRESLRGWTKDGKARRAIDRVTAAARGAFDQAVRRWASSRAASYQRLPSLKRAEPKNTMVSSMPCASKRALGSRYSARMRSARAFLLLMNSSFR